MILGHISIFFCTFAFEMCKKCLILIVFCWCCNIFLLAQSFDIENVLEDIYNQLSEDDEVLQEDLQEQLMGIAAHPINLNHTNADELSRLMFLSDEQIDAILLYQYKHAFRDIYELQLIDCLKDYEIRNMLPFVYVGEVETEDKIYFREVFRYAHHEITLRADARNIEDYPLDPMYGKLRYRFNYQNRVQAGLSVTRRANDGSPKPEGERWDYGGFIQLRDMGPMQKIVAGNFQANFGYGLVVGSPFKRGKTAYIQSTSKTDEGLKKYTSVGDNYPYFHGIGATAQLSHWADISTFYSLRQGKDDAWNHIVGVNATGRWNRLKVGVTAIQDIQTTGQGRQATGAMGVNARWNQGKVDIWGELATSHNSQWGIAGIAGLRYTPIADINLLAIYRYYSADFHNTYANALCSRTQIKDEHGGYLGIQYNRLKHWQLSAFSDVWKTGYEAIAQADFLPKKDYRMHMRFRIKNKDDKTTYSLRWNMVYTAGPWKMKTQADGNLVNANKGLSYGWSVLQDVEYHFLEIPIVLQLRAQAFDAQQWDNRVYIYEPDILYAYAIPFVYGLGGRFLLNARYKISDVFSVYLRLSETIYQHQWASEHDKKSTRTDVHALLRIQL